MSEKRRIGISGKIASFFIDSKITPIIAIAAIILGVFITFITPSEEEPQIRVPMVDIFVQYPGASAKEVEEVVTRPLEKLIWEIKGVEYVYSTSLPGMSVVTARYLVGEDEEEALVKLYNKLMSNMDRIPPGVSMPLVKPKFIDDVPILTLTFWSDRYDGYDLRKVVLEVESELKQVENVSQTFIVGGLKRKLLVYLDPEKLAARNLSPPAVIPAIQAGNARYQAGSFQRLNREIVVETGSFITSREDLESVLVGVYQGKPVYLRDVARIVDGPEEPEEYVLMGVGPRGEIKGIPEKFSRTGEYTAVTLAIAKKKGSNATILARKLLSKVDALKGKVIPADVNVTVTRNYGETAKEKSDDLLRSLLEAIITVVLVVAIGLGWRESLVVGIAVPVTLALTLVVNFLYGYTLNRVTLFALIFTIGILVDDAIVVVENIYRHFVMRGASQEVAIEAVDEVGNPTIIATFTIIAAILPMAFVRGLMGPYMRPIPVGASAAMFISLLVAFIISPWASSRVLKHVKPPEPEGGEEDEEKEKKPLRKFYERIMTPLIDRAYLRYAVFGIVAFLLLVAVALFPLKVVTVKMLPFDNKSEMNIVIDMPEGTTLEQTTRVAKEMGDYLRTVPEVTDFQIYAGTASPFNLNGMVRHYYLRRGPNVADIQVNFVPKKMRKDQSHDIAIRIRGPLKKIGDKYGARVKVVEVPPGPPVLSTLVAEVYGPDLKGQIEVAKKIKEIFESTDGVVDVDWFVEDDQSRKVLVVDREKAALSGLTVEDVAKTIAMSLSGARVGVLHSENYKEPVQILVRLPREKRSGADWLKNVKLNSKSGRLVPLSEVVKEVSDVADKSIYHKNLKRVVYVVGDVAGTEESPVYAILKMKERISKITLPLGYELQQYMTRQPFTEDKYSMKWDGEWQITYEVFRDLGIAFAAVMVLIYIFIVGEFKSFIIPFVIMVAIPLTLVGIIPGHVAMGAFFTATSMIGFIALSGIVVRNSILLVDFVHIACRENKSLKEAVIEAGAIRFRPIAMTALTTLAGSMYLLTDPIFQGLAISIVFGIIASTGLTLVVVPLVFYELHQRKGCPEGAHH